MRPKVLLSTLKICYQSQQHTHKQHIAIDVSTPAKPIKPPCCAFALFVLWHGSALRPWPASLLCVLYRLTPIVDVSRPLATAM